MLYNYIYKVLYVWIRLDGAVDKSLQKLHFATFICFYTFSTVVCVRVYTYIYTHVILFLLLARRS